MNSLYHGAFEKPSQLTKELEMKFTVCWQTPNEVIEIIVGNHTYKRTVIKIFDLNQVFHLVHHNLIPKQVSH